jgi:xanthine dehydrogenase YagR molybdenum-binding subunit
MTATRRAQRRVDARDKVMGRLRYGADRLPDRLAYAVFATADIAKGRILGVDTGAAREVPGVQLVITRFDPQELASPGFLLGGGYGFQSLQPLTATASPTAGSRSRWSSPTRSSRPTKPRS